MASKTPKQSFLCDAMLAKLARWLRMFGYDTELASSDESDDAILERARLEERTVLTRDRKIGSSSSVFLLSSSDPAAQVRTVVKEFKLEIPENPVPLYCSVCNGHLRVASEKELPRHVTRGWVCVECGQQYWEGAHWKGIKKFVEKVREGKN